MKFLIFVFSLLSSSIAFAQQDVLYQVQQDSVHQEAPQFTEAELAQMLAPIALYPDSLLTHILIASTYPIEIVEAHRWLKKNEELTPKKLAQSVKDFDWDASVKALVPFERILARLSEDLSWTQQLGDAFLQDEETLLESIQALRKQAEIAGNLDKMDNMEVSYEDDAIVITPREKEIVYIPYYDTRMVYGSWHWSSYPPVYWTPHHSVYVSHYNPFYWHSGIHISFNYFFSAFHWHNRHVVVVNSHRSHHYRGHRQISSGGYAKRWAHKPAHRKGVAYRSKVTSQKYRSNRAIVHKANKRLHTAQQSKVQRRFKQALSTTNYSTSNRKTYKVQTKSRAVSPAKSKPYIARVKANEPRERNVYQQNVKLKKVAPKNHTKSYKKSASTHKSVPVRNKQKNSSRKQNHQQKPMKNHNSKAAKKRHK